MTNDVYTTINIKDRDKNYKCGAEEELYGCADSNSQEVADSNATLLNENESSNGAAPRLHFSNCQKYSTVVILFFINLLNYMDRFTIAGVLISIQEFFDINNAMGGLLQTVFIVSYMLVAPLFGYLGDRYNRKILIVIGMVIWSGFTLLASFVKNPNMFPVFLLLRALVGVGEASYSTIAPTLIGDLFVGQKRTQMLSIFYFAIPLGSGFGYIVGSQAALIMGSWEWSLRVTPIFGVFAILLVIFLVPNPPRGVSESRANTSDSNHNLYTDDLKYLGKNKSFISVTTGFTFMAFVIGSLTLWGPVYFAYVGIATNELDPCSAESCDYARVNFLFGIVTCIGGFVGIGVGAEWARRWKLRGQENADPIVCAIGLMAAVPFLFIGVHAGVSNVEVTWVMIFFSEVSLCLTWTLVGDMTLYVTEPSRRSTANAVMILVGHLLGDAGSPYLIGMLSDSLSAVKEDTYLNKYFSLQQALYVTIFASVLGGGAFLLASLHIVRDKNKVEKFVQESSSSESTRTTSFTRDSPVSCPPVKHININDVEAKIIEDNCNLSHQTIRNKDSPGHSNAVYGPDSLESLLDGKETVI